MPSIIVSALAIGAGFMILYGLATIFENLALSRRGARTDGKILEWQRVVERTGGMSDGGDSTVTLYYPVVQFEVEGKRYRFESSNSFSKKKWKLGSSVPVVYDKADPNKAQLVTGRWGQAIFLIVFGAIILGVFAFLKFSSIR